MVAAPANVPALAPEEPDEDDAAVLDAYSAAVSAVAETLSSSVASLRVSRQVGGWSAGGAGSGVAFTPDGYLVTSAHVVAGTDRGTAAFTDGTEREFRVIGRDPLTDLAVLGRKASSGQPGLATPPASRSASWSWPSATRSGLPDR